MQNPEYIQIVQTPHQNAHSLSQKHQTPKSRIAKFSHGG